MNVMSTKSSHVFLVTKFMLQLLEHESACLRNCHSRSGSCPQLHTK